MVGVDEDDCCWRDRRAHPGVPDGKNAAREEANATTTGAAVIARLLHPFRFRPTLADRCKQSPLQKAESGECQRVTFRPPTLLLPQRRAVRYQRSPVMHPGTATLTAPPRPPSPAISSPEPCPAAGKTHTCIARAKRAGRAIFFIL